MIGLLFLLSCSSREQEKDTRTVFRYNESMGITSLDPAFARNQTIIWPVNQIFNGLVQIDDSLNILPCIAKSWEILENGTCYRFILRKDITFHDHPKFEDGKGRRVVASDVVYSFNRIIDPTIAPPGAWIFNNLNTEKEGTINGLKPSMILLSKST